MSTEKRVTPISEETRYAIKRKSAYALPSNPSERGMSAEEIKKAFYAPVTETAASVLSELDRVVAETNEVFEEAQGDRADKLAEAKQYTDAREAAVRSYADAENAKQDDVTAQLAQELGQTQEEVDEHGERLSTVEQTLSDTVLPGMDSLEERKAEKISPTTAGELVHTGTARITGPTVLSDTTVEGTLSNARLDTAYGEIEQSKLDILQLRAELSGKGRIFSLPDFSSLINFLQYGGKDTAQIFLMENGTAVYYTASDLKTGDVIYIKEVNVPDVWWITTDSEEGAYSYTYNGIDHVLIGRSEYGGSIIGQAQPLETDYMVIEQHATAASLSAQQAASRASEAATSAGQAAGYAAEAKEEKEGAKMWSEVAEQAAAEAKGFAETAATHVLAAEEQSALSAEAAERATAEADRAQSIVEASNEHLRQELEPRVARNTKRITNLEQGLTPDPFLIDSSVAYVKDVPTNALPYAEVTKVGGMTHKSKNLCIPNKLVQEQNGYIFMTNEDGSITVTGAASEAKQVVVDMALSVTPTMRTSIELEAGVKYSIQCTRPSNSPQGIAEKIVYTDEEGGICWGWSGQDISRPRKIDKLYMQFTPVVGQTDVCGTYKIMINEGDTKLPYEPYFEGLRNAIVTEISSQNVDQEEIKKVVISTEIQLLAGYGQSNPDNAEEYNYIDWEKQKFVAYGHIVDGAWVAFDTVKETDISDILSVDNLIEVEGGGTVTMVNEYGLPVPSEITYMLKEESE